MRLEKPGISPGTARKLARNMRGMVDKRISSLEIKTSKVVSDTSQMDLVERISQGGSWTHLDAVGSYRPFFVLGFDGFTGNENWILGD